MRIALIQFNPVVGDNHGNTLRMVEMATEALEQGAEMIVFPELSICGYPPMDLLNYPGFVAQCESCLDQLLPLSKEALIIVGCPTLNEGPGKALFNSAVLLNEGKIAGKVHKTLLPTYDIFDEYRYFEPNREFKVFGFHGLKIAVTICEDLWNLTPNPQYVHNPMDTLATGQPDLVINLAASPFSEEHPGLRNAVLEANAKKYRVPVVYVNQCGAQTDLIFDGFSGIVLPDGTWAARTEPFEEGILVAEYPSFPEPQEEHEALFLIHKALVIGIRDYFRKCGFQKAVLGLSGGVDSALVAVLAAEALGSENVLAVLMPSMYSSEHSISDSLDLCQNLGMDHITLPIGSSFEHLYSQLSPHFGNRPFNLAEENIQSRIRGMMLMALSNKMGYILLNTTNKSEMAVGYGTLYGDMCGALSVLGDVYKTKVYELCHWINQQKRIIPDHILTKPPSAELRPDQKDSDSLPEYEVLDPILNAYIEKNHSLPQIVSMGFEEKTVAKVIQLVNQSEFKRKQAAPVLRVSARSFGNGRRMPIVSKFRF